MSCSYNCSFIIIVIAHLSRYIRFFIIHYYSYTSSLRKQPKTITLEQIPSELKDTIIGLALGDLHIRRRSKNSSLSFKQSIKNEPYIIHLYTLFQEFCKMSTKIYDEQLKDKVHKSIFFDIKQKRGYTTLISYNKLWVPEISYNMDSWFITGFTDAEGCFSISIQKTLDIKQVTWF